jgi:hypothetical protein
MKEPPEDRRISSLINQSQTVRIRPVESQYTEEIRPTLNVTWDGLYFATSIGHYFSGMVVYVTRGFQSSDPANREKLGTVVRVDKMKEGRWGIAVHLAREADTNKITSSHQ